MFLFINPSLIHLQIRPPNQSEHPAGLCHHHRQECLITDCLGLEVILPEEFLVVSSPFWLVLLLRPPLVLFVLPFFSSVTRLDTGALLYGVLDLDSSSSEFLFSGTHTSY